MTHWSEHPAPLLRWLIGFGLVALVASGCNSGTDAPISFGSSQSDGASATTVASEPPRLDVRSVLLRYVGDTGEATFEVVICNTGITAADDVGVSVAAGGFAATVAFNAALPRRMCVGCADSSTRLADFGVVAPGPTVLEVVVDDAGRESIESITVEVERITVTAPPDQIALVEQCRTLSDDGGCVDHVPYAPVPGEVMVVDGFFRAIAPVELEQLAVYAVESMQNCLPRIEEFLGISGPRPIAHRTIVSDDASSYSSGVSWSTSGHLQRHLEAVDELGLGMWANVVDGYCERITAHELTHLVEGDTPLPGWLIEGLARWMEDRSRSNAVELGVLQCREDAWFDDSAVTWVPFSSLLDGEANSERWDLYQTAGCFWDYLYSTHGHESVRAILRELANQRDPMWNGCEWAGSVFFIRDIVNPILGVDISAVTESRWGIGATYTGCEGP